MIPAVILDKNFLQGASASEVINLAATHRLVMPGALFYELLTTEPSKRRKCFMKLPRIDNPVELVDHIGILLRREVETREPAGQPSSHRLDIVFRFNESLLDESYVLPAEATVALEELKDDVEDDIDRLITLSETIESLFPDLLEGDSQTKQKRLAETEMLIANPYSVLDFYRNLESPSHDFSYPPIDNSPEQWAHIRWLQVLMLFATSLHVRYAGSLRSMMTPAIRTRLEHDIHDAQILALGVLVGAIATKEVKLRRWWKLLRPDGAAFPRDASLG